MSSGNEVIDSGMVVFFQSPHSYTGEDVVEFHCHGNPMIVSLVVDEAAASSTTKETIIGLPWQ